MCLCDIYLSIESKSKQLKGSVNGIKGYEKKYKQNKNKNEIKS